MGSSHELIPVTNSIPFINKSITSIDLVVLPYSKNLLLQKFDWVRNTPIHLQDYFYYSIASSLHESHTFHKTSSNLFTASYGKRIIGIGETQTWDLVYLPLGKSLVGCRCIYKFKTHFDGTIKWYKTCVIAKGYTQEYRIDYEETFALVTQLTSVHNLVAIDVARKWNFFSNRCQECFS